MSGNILNTLNTGGIQALERVIGFTEARHEILANNLANIDTPGYKMKDLDVGAFQKDLREATEARTHAATSKQTQSAQIDYNQYLLFHDGNNRSIEKQISSMTQNGMVHNVATEILRSRYQILQLAIKGKL